MDRITALWKNQGILGDFFRGVVTLLGFCLMVALAAMIAGGVEEWAKTPTGVTTDNFR